VILFDHVGAGASDLSAFDRTRHSNLNGYACDLLELCDALQLRDAVFVGHSVGAMIGILAALREPVAFSRLVLVGPSPCYVNDGAYRGGFEAGELDELLEFMDSNYLGWSEAIAPQIMGNPDRADLGAGLTKSFCSTDPEIARHFARVTFFSDNRSELAGVRTPSLIMQCSDDIIAPASVGAYMHEQMPNSALVQLRATGHCPHVSHPAEVIEVIRCHMADGPGSDCCA
jgi:sigma-B regulation protein RsbQ